MDKWDDLPNWACEIHEVSAGVYRLKATHRLGPTIELSGINPDELIKQAQIDAARMEREIHQKIG